MWAPVRDIRQEACCEALNRMRLAYCRDKLAHPVFPSSDSSSSRFLPIPFSALSRFLLIPIFLHPVFSSPWPLVPSKLVLPSTRSRRGILFGHTARREGDDISALRAADISLIGKVSIW